MAERYSTKRWYLDGFLGGETEREEGVNWQRGRSQAMEETIGRGNGQSAFLPESTTQKNNQMIICLSCLKLSEDLSLWNRLPSGQEEPCLKCISYPTISDTIMTINQTDINNFWIVRRPFIAKYFTSQTKKALSKVEIQSKQIKESTQQEIKQILTSKCVLFLMQMTVWDWRKKTGGDGRVRQQVGEDKGETKIATKVGNRRQCETLHGNRRETSGDVT